MAKQTNTLGQPVGFGVDDWQPRPRPGRTAMIGQYCLIEPLRPEVHAEHLYQAFSSEPHEGDWTYLPYGPFGCLADFRSWLVDFCSGDDPLFHVVIDGRSAHAVGLASYLRIEPAVGVIEVGHIHFSPLMQKTPMATEAMYLMMRRVFDELGYRRYEWKCDACNERSKRAALRLGFSFEGTFRQATIYKGRNRDTAWFSLLDSEWPAIRAEFESWLETGNFDDQGQQKRRLNNGR